VVAPFLQRLCVKCVGWESIRGREANTSLSRDTPFELQPASFTMIHCLRELCGRQLALLTYGYTEIGFLTSKLCAAV
jgi:hypothetical protein